MGILRLPEALLVNIVVVVVALVVFVVVCVVVVVVVIVVVAVVAVVVVVGVVDAALSAYMVSWRRVCQFVVKYHLVHVLSMPEMAPTMYNLRHVVSMPLEARHRRSPT